VSEALPQVESVMGAPYEAAAEPYARALLDSLAGDDEAVAVDAELRGVLAAMGRVKGADLLLSGAVVPVRERALMIARLFAGQVSATLEALLYVMAEGDRLDLLPAVRRAFHSDLLNRQGRLVVVVTTAVELAQTQRLEVGRLMTGLLGKEPELTFRVDRKIVGGLVMRIGDRLYDASIRRELNEIQRRLAAELKLAPTTAFGGEPNAASRA
jgi:F-type H+-transporting ATPase subunit delta